MRDRSDIRADRFAAFPFSIGCVSQSAVSVADQQQNKPHLHPTTPRTPSITDQEGEGEKPRGQSGVVTGIQRLIESFKSLSQLFVVYEDEEEEEEREMVIGIPTDVQHVGHIGWDGFNKAGGLAARSGGRQDQFLNLSSSLSLKQLELAMGAQGGGLGHK